MKTEGKPKRARKSPPKTPRKRARKQATSSAPGEAAKAHEWLMQAVPEAVGEATPPETPAPKDPRENLSPAWKPGQSGNPKGRPKGSRNKLGESFLTDLQADWAEHGAKAIATVREERPHEYLKVVASILPKELNVRVDPLEEIDDDELGAILAAARAIGRAHQEAGTREVQAGGGKPAGVLLS